MKFEPYPKKKIHVEFQCSMNMTLDQIVDDINNYISLHKKDIYLDKTDIPVYLKRYVLVQDNTLWDK